MAMTARQFLIRQLAHAPVSRDTLHRRGARHGFSVADLENAADALLCITETRPGKPPTLTMWTPARSYCRPLMFINPRSKRK